MTIEGPENGLMYVYGGSSRPVRESEFNLGFGSENYFILDTTNRGLDRLTINGSGAKHLDLTCLQGSDCRTDLTGFNLYRKKKKKKSA